MIVAHVMNSPVLIYATEAALLETDPEIVFAVCYKPSKDRDVQMTRHKDLEAEDDHKRNCDWKSQAQHLHDYAEYRNNFLDMHSAFQFITVGHVGQVNNSKHCIEVTGENTQSVHWAHYRADPKTGKFEKVDIDKMLLQIVIDLSQT